MFVKIFKPKAAFSGVKYNSRKIDGNKGQLMKVANFGPLQSFGHLKPQDYINYLTALAALNKNVKLPQFHAVISAKGKSYDKITLTAVAESWLKEIGYGSQPYLIVFHHDTDNNHVHLVSARVDREGRKISSAFEGLNAQKSMNKVLGYEKAMQYKFSTRAQFFMIMESFNYPGKDPDEKLLQEKIANYKPVRNHAMQLRSILIQNRHRTDLPGYLKETMGIELIFHAAEGKKPYGYSIIDHEQKEVFKGSEVLPLRELYNSDAVSPGESSLPAEEKIMPSADYIGPVAIADDVDDQQIHGMRRRRQKRARTNTR